MNADEYGDVNSIFRKRTYSQHEKPNGVTWIGGDEKPAKEHFRSNKIILFKTLWYHGFELHGFYCIVSWVLMALTLTYPVGHYGII